jgi:hypothetical protein
LYGIVNPNKHEAVNRGEFIKEYQILLREPSLKLLVELLFRIYQTPNYRQECHSVSASDIDISKFVELISYLIGNQSQQQQWVEVISGREKQFAEILKKLKSSPAPKLLNEDKSYSVQYTFGVWMFLFMFYLGDTDAVTMKNNIDKFEKLVSQVNHLEQDLTNDHVYISNLINQIEEFCDKVGLNNWTKLEELDSIRYIQQLSNLNNIKKGK